MNVKVADGQLSWLTRPYYQTQLPDHQAWCTSPVMAHAELVPNSTRWMCCYITQNGKFIVRQILMWLATYSEPECVATDQTCWWCLFCWWYCSHLAKRHVIETLVK